jgi:VWFA-related protein
MKLQLLTVAAISAATLSAPLQAQNPAGQARPVFRSTADVVSIQTSVRDKRGRPMSGLTPTDFEVRDNGHVRPVISLRSDRHAPVSIAVLVDMSGSMRVGPKVAMARQAFGALLAQLREGQDEVAVFTFDSSLHERQPFTNRLATVSQSLVEFSPFGSTSLYDAAAATAKRLSERSATHKAIVILTDGVDTSSALTAPEVSGLASSIDVPVYILATVPVVDQDQGRPAHDRARSADQCRRDRLQLHPEPPGHDGRSAPQCHSVRAAGQPRAGISRRRVDPRRRQLRAGERAASAGARLRD